MMVQEKASSWLTRKDSWGRMPTQQHFPQSLWSQVEHTVSPSWIGVFPNSWYRNPTSPFNLFYSDLVLLWQKQVAYWSLKTQNVVFLVKSFEAVLEGHVSFNWRSLFLLKMFPPFSFFSPFGLIRWLRTERTGSLLALIGWWQSMCAFSFADHEKLLNLGLSLIFAKLRAKVQMEALFHMCKYLKFVDQTYRLSHNLCSVLSPWQIQLL